MPDRSSVGTLSHSHVIRFFFFFNDTATTEIYTLSLHDALPIYARGAPPSDSSRFHHLPRARQRSEEHTSELQSRGLISYAVFCLKKKHNNQRPANGEERIHTANARVADPDE